MAGILDWLKRKPDPGALAGRRLCDAVIAQARQPAFYRNGLAADTFEGRFELTALHGALLMRRLRTAGPDGSQLAERLVEALFDRFDYALREEGVGDASIARRARKLGEEFYGLARALDGVLGGAAVSVAGLSDVLARNGLGGRDPAALARHVLDESAALEQCSDAELLCGDVTWAS